MAVDAYVFVRNADLETIERLRSLSADGGAGIRVVDALTGPADAFVAIEGADVGAVRRTVQGPMREAGARDTDVAIAVYPAAAQRIVRRWLRVPEYTAFTRIRVRPGRARAVTDAVSELDGYLGAAAVAGSYDVVAAFGADDLETLTDVMLGQLHELDDIAWTETAISQAEGADELAG
jgi:hypothetical protein